LERQKDYAALIDELHIIVYSPRENLPPLRIDNLYIYPTNSPFKAMFFFDALRLVRRLVPVVRPDLISMQDPFVLGWIARYARRRYGTKVNMQVHTEFLDNPRWIAEGTLNRLLNFFGKRNLRRADTVRVGTRQGRDKLHALGVNDHRIFVLPVPVDVQRFIRAEGVQQAEDEFKSFGFDRTCLFVGRLTYAKNLPGLLRAFDKIARRCPGTGLVIAGDGELSLSLRRLAGDPSLADRVRFLGLIPHERLGAYMAAADVFVLFSDYEGTCLVNIEAGLAGTPVVTTDISGARDVVEDARTGFIVPVRDSDAFADRVVRLLENDDLRASFGVAARERLTQLFDRDRLVNGVVDMWKQTLAR
jgi:glycosyltransferase involved in cell wall biosynthesis